MSHVISYGNPSCHSTKPKWLKVPASRSNALERLFCGSQGIPRQDWNTIWIGICHTNSYDLRLAGVYIYNIYIYTYNYIYMCVSCMYTRTGSTETMLKLQSLHIFSSHLAGISRANGSLPWTFRESGRTPAVGIVIMRFDDVLQE